MSVDAYRFLAQRVEDWTGISLERGGQLSSLEKFVAQREQADDGSYLSRLRARMRPNRRS